MFLARKGQVMKTRILIIGGDQKVIALIDSLRNVPGAEVVGVCDVTKNSLAMQYAKKTGIDTGINYGEFIIKMKADVVIETSGSEEFQKVLYQIVTKGVKVIDGQAAELLLQIARDKEEAKRYGQLYLVNKLSRVLAVGHDTHNIVWPIFELLKSNFKVCVEAILVFDEPKDELLIASDHIIDRKVTKRIIKYLKRESLVQIKRGVSAEKIDIFNAQKLPGEKKIPPLKSFLVIPLLTRTKAEGMMVLARAQSDAFRAEDYIVLNILADELALFIENERIKNDLDEAKSSLESMLYNMCEGVIVINTKKRITLLNQAAKSILGVKEIKLGKSVSEGFGDQALSGLFRDLSTAAICTIRELNLVSGKELKTLKFYIAPVTYALDKPSGWIILFTDITREKEVDRMKSEFISTTSHELRTPLAAIKESVMLMLDGTAGEVSRAQKRFLSIAKRNIDRLANLINDLLDIAKIETGKLKLKRVQCNIKELVDATVESLKVLVDENGLTVIQKMDACLPEISCDPDQIMQVLINLVSNSIKFTPRGGKITIACERKSADKKQEASDYIVISVSDTGIGIDTKDFFKLFLRFEQLDGSLTRKAGGTGLGLAICKELIAMHGGGIWVESEIGKGSIFRFTLPIDSK